MLSTSVKRARRRLRPVVRYFTRSSHRELLTRALKPMIQEMEGLVVDIGGGRDSPLAQFWASGTSRLRLDISARFEPDVIGDARALPLADGGADAVVLSEVLEHVSDPHGALAEIRRVLRPGGRLVGSVPFGLGVHADPHDYFRYTGDALSLLLEDFDDVRVTPHGNHVGVAWRALNERWHWLWAVNPAIRPFARQTDARWPVGYTFSATRPIGGDGPGDAAGTT